MANLGRKGSTYLARFRYQGKEYKKSLGTSDESQANGRLLGVEYTLHRLQSGQLTVPAGIDIGDFIVSAGTVQTPVAAAATVERGPAVSLRALVDEYTASQKNKIADTYLASQKIHLRHLQRFLGEAFDKPGDLVTRRDLDRFLQERLAKRDPGTVQKERVTLQQLFRWAVAQGYLTESPAGALAPIRGGSDRPPFRTVAEIERILARGGLTDPEQLDLWECLYLNPQEIGGLLAAVRQNAATQASYLVHLIPAYTGMRRGEVLRLRWIDLDLDGGYVVARSRKQSRSQRETSRRIDLHPDLRGVLEDWQQKSRRGQYVVTSGKNSESLDCYAANRAFWQPMRGTTWCLDRGRNRYKIGFHSYRHSFASNLAAAGVDQRVIDEFMGHTTDAMRRRYRHLFPENKRKAVNLLQYGV